MKTTDTKEAILKAALRLFSVKGYDAVGVTEIADAVGIKAPSLYKHYKSKRAIFESILERMEKMDSEQAKKYEMPQDAMQETCSSCNKISAASIGVYTKAMFLYWTKEEFPSCFRKMLALERYKSPEMSALYRQYILDGPVGYMADIFAEITNSEFDDAYLSALEFYGPMYFLYNLYDSEDNKEKVISLLEKHIDGFLARLEMSQK